MSKISKPETDQILSELADVKGVVELLTREAHLQAEMLAQIIILLTPRDRPPGPSLHELIVALITRIDRQSVMLKEIIESQAGLRQDVARLLHEGPFARGEATTGEPGDNGRGTNGTNGHAEDHPVR
jgi:hypothetical protein